LDAITEFVLHESVSPPAEFAEHANATAGLYARAEADRLAFWAEQAHRLSWDAPFTDVLDWSQAPFAKWFVGGTLNVAYNCVDRHVEAGSGDRVAIHWEGEPVGDNRTLTYAQLKDEVCRAANALADLGLAAGDRVAIYMPMVPEAIVAMLACAPRGRA
jgi:acetyl-CoA synthetase